MHRFLPLPALTFTYSSSPTAGFFLLSGSIEFDNAGTLTGVTNGNFVCYFVFATNNPSSPIYVIMGQRQDTSLANARTNNDPSTLSLDSVPSAEMKLLYRVIIQQTNPTTQVISATDDFRSVSNAPITSYVPTSHRLDESGLCQCRNIPGLWPAMDLYHFTGGVGGVIAAQDDNSTNSGNNGLLLRAEKERLLHSPMESLLQDHHLGSFSPGSCSSWNGVSGSHCNSRQWCRIPILHHLTRGLRLGNGVNYAWAEFNHSSTQRIQWLVRMPTGWDGGNLTVIFGWLSNSVEIPGL